MPALPMPPISDPTDPKIDRWLRSQKPRVELALRGRFDAAKGSPAFAMRIDELFAQLNPTNDAPDPATLHPALLADGWHVMDKFGALDGPYASASEAWAIINRERAELGRHESYGKAP